MRGPRHFDPDMLHAALRGLESERDKLDAIIRDIRTRLEGKRARPSGPKQDRTLSAAGRRRIVEAQKERWAEFHNMRRKAARPKAAAKTAKRSVPAQAAVAPEAAASAPELAVQVQAAAAGSE